MKNIVISMWSDEHKADAVADILWTVAALDGHIARTVDDLSFFAVCKEPFSDQEANVALERFCKHALEPIKAFKPQKWQFAYKVYAIVRTIPPDKPKVTSYIQVRNLADADIDWDSMEEFWAAEKVDIGTTHFKSEDKYLWIYRTIAWDGDEYGISLREE